MVWAEALFMLIPSFHVRPVHARRTGRRPRDVLGNAARPYAVPWVEHATTCSSGKLRGGEKVHHGCSQPFASVHRRLHDRLCHMIPLKESGVGIILLLSRRQFEMLVKYKRENGGCLGQSPFENKHSPAGHQSKSGRVLRSSIWPPGGPKSFWPACSWSGTSHSPC